MSTESPWLAKVRKAIGSRQDCMFHRQHAGTYCPPGQPKVFIKVAPDGIADLMGIQMRRVSSPNVSVIQTINPNGFQPVEKPIEWFYGQAIAIETKSATGSQRESQKLFERAWRSQGGVYILAKANDWESIWDALGREADPLCSQHASTIWHTLTRELGLDAPKKPARKRRAA